MSHARARLGSERATVPVRAGRDGMHAMAEGGRGFVSAVAAMLVATACGGAAQLPPLPPAPHPAVRGPGITAIQRAGVLRVAADLSFPPMAYREAGVPRGFEVELAGLLAHALGVRLDVLDVPRAVIRAGFPPAADLILSSLSADQAPGLPSAPYYVSGRAILWRAGAPVHAPGELRGRRVAAAVGVGDAAAVAGTLVPFYLPEQALAAVADGRAEAAVGDRAVLLWYAHTHSGLGVTADASPGTPLVAVARADAPDLAAFVSAAIRELDRSGGLAQLRRRWRL